MVLVDCDKAKNWSGLSRLAEVGSGTKTCEPNVLRYDGCPEVYKHESVRAEKESKEDNPRDTHVSVRILSCNSCKLDAISSPHGVISI